MTTPREPGGHRRGRYEPDPDPYDPDPYDPGPYDPYAADPHDPYARDPYGRDAAGGAARGQDPDGDPTWGRAPAGGWGAPRDDRGGRDPADPYAGPYADGGRAGGRHADRHPEDPYGDQADGYAADGRRDDGHRYRDDGHYDDGHYGDGHRDDRDGLRYVGDRGGGYGHDGYGSDGYRSDGYGYGSDGRAGYGPDDGYGPGGRRRLVDDEDEDEDDRYEPEPVPYRAPAGRSGVGRGGVGTPRRGPRTPGRAAVRPVRRPPWILLGAAVLVAGAIGVLGFVTPGWFVTRVLDHDAVQAGVAKVVTGSYGAEAVADVRCPADVRVTDGATFTCDATVDGDAVKVPVRVTGTKGDYEVGRPT